MMEQMLLWEDLRRQLKALEKLWTRPWANWLRRLIFFKIYTHRQESHVIFQIEVSLAVLWEGARDNPAQLKARKEIIDLVQTVQEQIQLWSQADKMKQDIAKLADTDAMDVEED